MYGKFFDWAFKTGKVIKEVDEDLLRKLIFDIRGEETPGRFFNKLVNRLAEYRTNRNINLNLSIEQNLMQENWMGDKFYYIKASILSGFLNALSYSQTSESQKNE